MELRKIVVFVPIDYADKIRQVIGEAGGGRIGNYSFCSFSTRGIGRFKPEVGATPAIGEIGKMEEVEEERIEFVCRADQASEIVTAIKAVHPYEEVALDIYSLEEVKDGA